MFLEDLLDVPLKMTSSIPEPRILLAEVSPITHLKDSTILDLPQPLGPTMPVKPFPDHLSLMPGDNIYKTFPNLYTIRGTTHRDVAGWVNSLDHMRSFNPQFLFPSHTKPLSGIAVMETLTIYRDAIQFVHDQTVRLMNKGLTPDEIIEKIKLPTNLAKSPFLSEYYGTIRWSVKSIFNGYLGNQNGTKLADGVYMYTLELVNASDDYEYSVNGTVTIMDAQ